MLEWLDEPGDFGVLLGMLQSTVDLGRGYLAVHVGAGARPYAKEPSAWCLVCHELRWMLEGLGFPSISEGVRGLLQPVRAVGQTWMSVAV